MSLVLTMQQAAATGGVAAAAPSSSSGACSCNKVVIRCGAAAGGPAAVELPLHLTERILCSMRPLESARHVTVCKSWASTVSARLARPVPHLFACMSPGPDTTNTSKGSDDRRGLVISVPLEADGAAATTKAAKSRVRSADTNGLRCIGATPGGRVAFAAGWWSADVVLVNPVTGELHRVEVGEPCRLDPRRSRVLAAGDGADSFFAVDGYNLTLWRRKARQGQVRGGGEKEEEEEEEAWSRCAVAGASSSPDKSIVSAVGCQNGRFYYVLHQDGCLSAVDATAQPPLRAKMLPVESLLQPTTTADQRSSLTTVKTEGRLLELAGEVLFVRQFLAYKVEPYRNDMSLSVAGFEVYRLDAKDHQRWTKVDRLPPDRALFVSPGSSFAVRASEVEGCRSNCIYFVGEGQYYNCPQSPGGTCREEDGGGETSAASWGIYSLEDRRVLFEHAVVTEPGRGAELCWFLPYTGLSSLQ